MKILHITPAYHPAVQWGGPIVSVHLLAKEQVRLGHQVEVYTTAFGLEKNKNQKFDKDGVRITYFKFFSINKRWFISWGLLSAVIKNRKQFDVIHIHVAWDPISWLSGFLLSFWGVKIIFSPRGEIEKALINKKSRLLKTCIYFLFLRRVFRKAYGLHFTSEYEKQQFIEYAGFEPRNAVILNPFESDAFAKPVDKSLLSQLGLENKKYFLYLGRVDWKKRADLLIKAFAEFNQRHPGFYLAILGAGDADYIQGLKQIAQGKNIDKQCVISGDLIYGDLRLAVFQNAFAFVLPSYSENFGFVAVEAMASGIPLIVSDGVGIKDMILKYNAGRVFRGSGASDERAVVNLLSEMEYVQDKSHHAELIENSRALVNQEFDNTRIAREMIQFYQ
jgi:glycosyltransferase involved in cell wall biosynthesis